jgi:hypothetical protein
LNHFRALAHRASAAGKASLAGEAMAVPLRWSRSRILGIPRWDSYFACRGFPEADHVKHQRLERIRRTFVNGYHATLEDSRPQTLAPWLHV